MLFHMTNDILMDSERVWCAIPVFNNEKTVREVAAGCRAILENVVVIDDGSTDADVASLLAGLDVTLLRHDKNLGKGVAIQTAARYIEDKGGLYMITIDADGQHYPEDVRKFIPLLLESDSDILIGCRDFDTDNVPGKSRFGRKFANFWLRMETGVVIDDCQSGFRAYPVKYLNQMQFKGLHYDFEAEVLAKSVWAGLRLRTVPINVYYPNPGERVSSFQPFLDNLRLSMIHSMLVGRRLIPIRHRKLVEDLKKNGFTFLRHPGKFLMMLLKENATPGGLAMAAAVGIFFGTLPLLFAHTIVIIYVAARLNLNKIVAVNVQHLCMPPFVPALCIEVGFYLRHGYWLTDLSFATVFAQFSSRLFEWFLGSLIVAPAGAIIVGAVFYSTASLFRKARSI
jgi:glycosyltransferase involved in cell wall biosynthesis